MYNALPLRNSAISKNMLVLIGFIATFVIFSFRIFITEVHDEIYTMCNEGISISSSPNNGCQKYNLSNWKKPFKWRKQFKARDFSKEKLEKFLTQGKREYFTDPQGVSRTRIFHPEYPGQYIVLDAPDGCTIIQIAAEGFLY